MRFPGSGCRLGHSIFGEHRHYFTAATRFNSRWCWPGGQDANNDERRHARAVPYSIARTSDRCLTDRWGCWYKSACLARSSPRRGRRYADHAPGSRPKAMSRCGNERHFISECALIREPSVSKRCTPAKQLCSSLPSRSGTGDSRRTSIERSCPVLTRSCEALTSGREEVDRT
jgi:hypothetical protein